MAAKRGYTYPAPSSAQFNQQKILTDSQENGVKAIPVTDFAKSQYEIQQAESESDLVDVEIVDKKIKLKNKTLSSSTDVSRENFVTENGNKVSGTLLASSTDIKKLERFENVSKDKATKENKGLNANGQEIASSYVSSSDFLYVKEGDVLSYNLLTFANLLLIAFYDENKSFVSGVDGTNARQSGTIIVEQDGFVRFCTKTVSLSNDDYFIYLSENSERISKIEETTEALEHYRIYDEAKISTATKEGKGLAISNGSETATGFCNCSDFIVVKKGDVVNFRLNTPSSSLSLALFNSSKTFVEGVAGSNVAQSEEYKVLQDGFIRFATKTSTITNASFFFEISKGSVQVENIENNVEELNELASSYIPQFEIQSGAGFSWNGKVSTSSFWANFNIAKINLSLGETLEAEFLSSTGDSSHPVVCERFTDGSLLKFLAYDGDYRTNKFVHTATKNNEVIWINYSVANSAKLNVVVKRYFSKLKQTSLNEVSLSFASLLRYRYKSAICIGDSLTYGQQTSVQGSGVSKDNYPRFLARMTGMEVTNAGVSGATPKYWLDNLASGYNFENYESAFICLGTNGTLAESESDENYVAYKGIIDLIKSQNQKCAIFLIDCVGASGNNETIESIANYYGVALIKAFSNDYYWLAGNNGSAVTPTHYRENDPTHLSPMGYLILARNIVMGMCEDMEKNVGKYNQELST